MAAGYADVAGTAGIDGSTQLISQEQMTPQLMVDKYILMVVQAIELIFVMLVWQYPLRAIVVLVQRFVCGQMLMLPTLIMPSALKIPICGFRCLHQHKASTGMLEYVACKAKRRRIL